MKKCRPKNQIKFRERYQERNAKKNKTSYDAELFAKNEKRRKLNKSDIIQRINS